MPRIAERKYYDGALEKIERLGLGALIGELEEVLTAFELQVMEEKDANGGATLRKLIDARFSERPEWSITKSGNIDWRKCQQANATTVCIGVEIQVSARSDLLAIDLAHLRGAIRQGQIDLGVLVVPSDRLGRFLTDRAPRFSDAVRHVNEARAEDLPLLVLGIEHDGPGAALPKQAKKRMSDYEPHPE